MAMLWISISAFAYDFEVDGIFYNITSMANLEVGVTHKYNDRPSYNSTYSGEITIPSTVNYNNRTFTVSSILSCAMGGWSEGSPITKISLPNTIKIIDKYAFSNCKNLEKCDLPDSVEKINDQAFEYTAITNAIIPNSTTTIGSYAFSYCKKLTSVLIGKGVSEIGDYAFEYCTSLLEVFFLRNEAPTVAQTSFYSTSPFIEKYVPSTKIYGFGSEYLTFTADTYNYTGQSHNIEWANNLKAYNCEISQAECVTESNAGQHTKYLTATYSNGIDFSVDIPYEYTINKAPMSLTVNNAERMYGDPNPAFTCNISGFVNGENEQTLGVTPSFECEATQMSKVGDYRILASLDAPNYEVTYKYGTLSVIKAPLTVSVVDATKIYGNQNPDFTLSFSGLKNGETLPEWEKEPVFSTPATHNSSVGQYEVTASESVPVNYEVTQYNPGILTISKRDLTAKANDCERLYNEENPPFDISYLGFVNGDSETSLSKKPITECSATKSTDAGTYPIVVTGGEAQNYNFVYQDGTLKINPLTVGFKDVYNSVTYKDMALSTSDKYFNFVPEITGPFSEDDFWIELWFLDKDNKYDQHVISISGGEYAGKYVNTNVDRTMWAGKYIFNLTPKGTNPNIVANPSRAYLTVNRTSNNLEWDSESPITVKVGEKVDLGITYQADLWCTFNTDYDTELISITSEGETGNNPHWYATGLKEGETTLYFSIECKKNDFGFYDFSDSRTLSKRIIVEGALSGINDVKSDDNSTSVIARDGSIYILNKDAESIVRVFSIQGIMVAETSEDVVNNLSKGFYIVTVGTKSFKVSLR